MLFTNLNGIYINPSLDTLSFWKKLVTNVYCNIVRHTTIVTLYNKLIIAH